MLSAFLSYTEKMLRAVKGRCRDTVRVGPGLPSGRCVVCSLEDSVLAETLPRLGDGSTFKQLPSEFPLPLRLRS